MRPHDRLPARLPTVAWSMIVLDDDDLRPPDERCEGYWPSHDEQAHGYCPPDLYDAAVAEATENMRRWKADEWNYVGVIARATVTLEGRSFTMDSAGLWGIESYCTDYIAAVYADERAQLSRTLGKLALVLRTVQP